MRCLSLAECLKKNKQDIIFITNSDEEKISNQIINYEFNYKEIGFIFPNKSDLEQTCQIINQYKTKKSWVIIDGYNFNLNYLLRLKKESVKLLIIDDNCHQDHYIGDIILNQNAYSKLSDYKDKQAQTYSVALNIFY